MASPTLTDTQVDETAAQLAAASQGGTAVEQLVHEPGDVAEGYRIQNAGHRLHGDELIGWKAGCTSEAAQQMLRVDAPLVGRYRSAHVEQSPATFAADAFVTPPHLEVEVGLRVLRDLTDVPADPLDLAEFVEAFAAIEVVAGRLAAFPLIGAAQLAADNVVGARMVVGQSLDLDAAGLRHLDSHACGVEHRRRRGGGGDRSRSPRTSAPRPAVGCPTRTRHRRTGPVGRRRDHRDLHRPRPGTARRRPCRTGRRGRGPNPFRLSSSSTREAATTSGPDDP